MKPYILHFRERVDGKLYDRFRKIQAQNKHAAESYGKAQETKNYWFIGIVAK